VSDSAATGATGRETKRQAGTRYAERLYLAWWGWPLPLIAAGLLAAEIHMGYPGVRAWLPYVLLIPATAAIMALLSRTRVAVADDELWVLKAHLPLEFIGEIDVVPAEGKRRALGPDLDRKAYVMHRGWVGPLVRVHLTDPADPTPYWLFSTRHPERLKAALSDRAPGQ
jgi:hypothetical protein